jgi:3-oxoacyl-[acyl-carrier-protein] synthase II
VDAVVDAVLSGTSAVVRRSSGREGLAAPVLMAPARWTPGRHLTPRQEMAMDPVASMAVHAARIALADAGYLPEASDPAHPIPELADAGVHLGCGLGGAGTYEDAYARYFTRDARRLKPTTVSRVMPSAPAAHISMTFGIRGPSRTSSVACASSAVALGEAYRAIRDGYLECVVAGGTEAMLSGGVVLAWEAMGVLARPHPDGDGASVRPFDRERTGFALGEGAANIVLETEGRARERGATVLGEVCGYGASSDACNLTRPSRDGQVRAMRAALSDAGVPPEAVGYVNAHATGTQVGDAVEAEAIAEVFAGAPGRVAVSSTKSMHGHLVGAAGALEAALTLLALRRGILPPTANLDDPDPACPVEHVRGRGRAAPEVDLALTNAFAFGGANASLVLRRGAV